MENRKAFNFYRSYYDVAMKLSNEDRCEFLTALLQKQFDGIEPKLTGMAEFAYISQRHAIDSQIKGFVSKTKSIPTEPPYQPPSVQEQGEEQEQEKEEVQAQELDIELEADKLLKKLQDKLYERTSNGLAER